MSSELFSPLVLRSGATLRNRIAKAAMEEGMAGSAQLPDERLISLYRRWGAGGAGLLITGNVMVHAEALTGSRAGSCSTIARRSSRSRAGRRPARPAARRCGCRSATPAGRCRRGCRGWSGRPSAVAVELGQTQQALRPARRDDRRRRSRRPSSGSRRRPASPSGPASTASRSTPRTAICSRSSSRRWSTSASDRVGRDAGEPRAVAARCRARDPRRRVPVVRGRGQAELGRLPARRVRRRGRGAGDRDARAARGRSGRALRRQLREPGDVGPPGGRPHGGPRGVLPRARGRARREQPAAADADRRDHPPRDGRSRCSRAGWRWSAWARRSPSRPTCRTAGRRGDEADRAADSRSPGRTRRSRRPRAWRWCATRCVASRAARTPRAATHPLHAFVCDQRAQRRALRRYREWLEARG